MDKIDARRVRDFFKVEAVACQGRLSVDLRSVGLPSIGHSFNHEGSSQQPYKKKSDKNPCDAVACHLPVPSLNAFLNTSGVT